MKRLLMIIGFGLILGGCASFQKSTQYEIGMEESDFLKRHNDAVISKLEDGQKTYRVVRDDRFYILVTFENSRLVKLEEKELPTYWHQKKEPDESEMQ
ncbi:hypothetical protein IFO69_01615 [Echinicola sp. CAU 1574]|uniref:Cystatin-like fold lipoprotein n=1 Tax=Echinicola arenosa TaxID=2774144 RepID=A0ABR9AG41_9BACT|nr:hypothetical protein [Echinicola arenosa]MBD8487434.1 hypothetical protein [Echinicola arenosa]